MLTPYTIYSLEIYSPVSLAHLASPLPGHLVLLLAGPAPHPGQLLHLPPDAPHPSSLSLQVAPPAAFVRAALSLASGHLSTCTSPSFTATAAVLAPVTTVSHHHQSRDSPPHHDHLHDTPRVSSPGESCGSWLVVSTGAGRCSRHPSTAGTTCPCSASLALLCSTPGAARQMS